MGSLNLSKKITLSFLLAAIMMLGVVSPALATSSSPLDQWSLRDRSLFGVTYGDSTFVAVGANGAILTSPDGSIWQAQTSNRTNERMGEVAHGNNTFVAVGTSGTTLASTDGKTWNVQNSGTTNALAGVTYGDSTFVAVGTSGTILTLTSSDGTNWQTQAPSTTKLLSEVTYGNGTFVAVGASGTILTSPDGISWSDLTSTGTTNDLEGVAYGSGTFVAVGASGTILTSPNGTNWQTQNSGTTDPLYGATYGNGTFVAVGASGTILASPDGTNWQTQNSGTTNDLRGVTYADGTFVAVGANGTILTSPDGKTWQAQDSGITGTGGLSGVTYGNNTFVAVGENASYSNLSVTSSDGKTWQAQDSGITGGSLTGVTYGNNTFVAVGGSASNIGFTVTSSDGKTWSADNELIKGGLTGVTYGNNTFVAVGPGPSFGPTILTSPDGTNWSFLNGNNTTYPLNGVTYLDSIFVAFSPILTSPDGTNWTDRDPAFRVPLDISINGVAYGDNTFVTVGAGGAIMQSAALSVPTLTGISPASGPTAGGTPVTITGSDLSTVNAVYFGATPATSFTLDTDASMTAVSPPGTETVDVTVYGTGGASATSSSDQFTYGSGGGSSSVPSDDTLSSLSLEYGVLNQTFAPGTLTYTASDAYGTTSDTVTAVANSVYAQVYMNGTLGAVQSVPLSVGDNSVAIKVYAQDGTNQTYSLTIDRGGSVSSGGGGGGSSTAYTPAVQTEAATSITTDSAVLNGAITTDNGYSITDYGFLWGASSSSLTNKLDVGATNQSGAFTETLSGLADGTTYYFEAYATNSYGTADGTVMSFTTGVPTPTTTTPTGTVFSDVPPSYWGYAAISSLSSQGIVSGYPDNTFKPDTTVTRAEFATMLVKALGLSTSGTSGTFTDVTADSWYYGAVNAAVADGLVAGMGDNLFAPNALITREQMAVMVTKALGTKASAVDGTELNFFSDKSAVSSWAASGMEEAVKTGIVHGMAAGMLAPMADATRVQAAVMIYRLLSFLSK